MTFLLNSISDAVVFLAVGWVFALIRGILAGFLQFFGSSVDQIIAIPVADSPVVQNVWNLVRNFTNMFFIVALIIMAFSTIFSISRFDFRTLIVRFLIAVLLINFSLVIGNILIGWTQSLSNVFTGAIGGIGDKLGNAFRFGSRFATALPAGSPTQGIDLTTWQSIIAAFGDIAILAIAAFSMAVLFFMVLVRVPVLWALLIFSPVAWAAYILPNTNSISKKWWETFISWNLFLPIYLFFIYIALYIADPAKRTQLLGIGLNTSNSLNLRLDDVFFYILIALILIWGAKFAISSSRAGGVGALAGWAYGKGAVMRRAAWRKTGAPKAIEYYKKEGIKLPGGGDRRFFGSRQAEDFEAKMAGRWGVPGMDEKLLASRVDAETKLLKDKRTHLDKNALLDVIRTGSPEQKIAAAQLFTEENYGSLGPAEFTAVRKAFGKNMNTAVGASTFRKMKLNEMSTDDLNELLDPTSPNYINPVDDPTGNLRSLAYNALIEKRRIKPDQFNEALARPNVSGAQKASMISKAKEMLGEDMTSGDREAILAGLSVTPQTAKENREAIRELLKIRAQKGDAFFYKPDPTNPSGPPIVDMSKLKKLAEDNFEVLADRKKFLDDVAKKHAHSAAVVMLDQGLIKDDTGQVITRTGYVNSATGSTMTADEVEKLVTKQTYQKLSLDEKQTQNKAQWSSPVLREVAAEDMGRTSSSMQNWITNDKYQTFNTSTGGQVERQVRQNRFHAEYLGPFVDQYRKLASEVSAIRTGQGSTPPALPPKALDSTKLQLQNNNLTKLRKFRDDYETMCRKFNMVDQSVTTQLNGMDRRIKRLSDDISKL